MSPDPALVASVCERVADQPGDVARLVTEAVRLLAPLATTDERRALERAALARLSGLAELDVFVRDPTVDEVLVNDRRIWVDRAGRLEPAGELHACSPVELLERVLAPIGRRVDRTSPIVDARLPGGARVCAVLPPVAVDGPVVSIRRFAQRTRELADFTDDVGATLCRRLVAGHCNVVVTGATSSGKTSLLATLLALVAHERVVVVEDTAELPCELPHIVRLESRPATPEGLSPIDLAHLVRTALRLRPDRLVVGEVRGDEVLGLVQAMNTGHDGSFSTCHANGPADALLRLESLVLQASPGWPLAAIRHQLARSIDAIVHVERCGRRRSIVAIDEVVDDTGAGPLTTRPLARPDGERLRRLADPERTRR